MPHLTVTFDGRDVHGNALEDPSIFAQHGPVLEVVLLPHEGVKGAESQQGYAMIDTGASRSCVNEKNADKAGWPIIDTAKLASVTHPDNTVRVFRGRLSCAAFNTNIEVPSWMGVNLNNKGSPFPLVALIGRDLLQQAVFIYNGHARLYTLAI